PALGTLDALHLATALRLREIGGIEMTFLTHDDEFSVAARSMNFPVEGSQLWPRFETNVSGTISRSSSHARGWLRHSPRGNSGWRQTQPLDLVHISPNRRPRSFIDCAGLCAAGSRRSLRLLR